MRRAGSGPRAPAGGLWGATRGGGRRGVAAAGPVAGGSGRPSEGDGRVLRVTRVGTRRRKGTPKLSPCPLQIYVSSTSSEKEEKAIGDSI